jgi:hypothetical protein
MLVPNNIRLSYNFNHINYLTFHEIEDFLTVLTIKLQTQTRGEKKQGFPSALVGREGN